MPNKLRFYSNISKNFLNYFSPNFLRNYNISFSEEFFTSFSQHFEQMFDEVFHIYKKYFHEIDTMDFDNFFKPKTNNYLNILEEKNSILPYKIIANYSKDRKNNNNHFDINPIKKLQPKSTYKYEIDESSLDNIFNENKNNDKIKISDIDSLDKSNNTYTNILPKSKKSENVFDTDRNISNDTQNKSTDTNIRINRLSKNSFYSYPQSGEQNNIKDNNADSYLLNNFESLGEKQNFDDDKDFVMRNVQKVKKLYSNRIKTSREYYKRTIPDNNFLNNERRNEEFISRNGRKIEESEENKISKFQVFFQNFIFHK